MSQLLRDCGTRQQPQAAIETDIPYRLDRLPWGRFHWLLVTALGVTWWASAGTQGEARCVTWP